MNALNPSSWRRGFGALLIALAMTGCVSTSHRTALEAADAQPGRSAIRWPADYAPEQATFYVHNEIEIAAPPAVVWAVLIEAERWPEWYAGATELSLEGAAPGGRLTADTVLRWRTMGLRFESTLREFEPPHRLAWESRKSTIRGYHAWLIEPLPDGGSRVVTAEAQFGFLAVMQGVFIPNKLHRLHDEWLAGLKRLAEARVKGDA